MQVNTKGYSSAEEKPHHGSIQDRQLCTELSWNIQSVFVKSHGRYNTQYNSIRLNLYNMQFYFTSSVQPGL